MSDPIWLEINSRPSTLRPWGSGLSDKAARRIPKLEPIGERPVRLQMFGPCKWCGEKRYACNCGEAA